MPHASSLYMWARVHAKSYLAPHSASCRCKTEFTIIYILQQQPSTDQQRCPQVPLAYSWPVATPQPPQAATGFILLFYNVVCCSYELYPPCLWTRAWGKGYLEVPEDFTIMEKAPTSPGWKHLLELSHLRHYLDSMLNRHWPHGK